MVFAKILYYLRSLLRGAPGAATDLASPANDAGMENRADDWNHRPQLDPVQNHDGIHSDTQGIL